jgi:hypothetical protein
MAFWVGVYLIVGYFRDVKFLILPSIAFQVLEPLDGHSFVAGDKMKQVLEFLIGQGLDVLPEPFNHLICGLVARVDCVGFKVAHVYLLFSGDNHIKFVRFEDGEQIGGDCFVEAVFEVGD